MSARLRIGAASHAGRRNHNDDWFCVGDVVSQSASFELELDDANARFREYGWLCAVADGIGGYEGGSRAAQLALEILSKRIYARPRGGLGGEDVVRSLEEDFIETNRVLGESLRAEGLGEAGTTLAGLLLLLPDIAVKFWCGDSRILRASGGYVRALSLDHSPLARDVMAGVLSEEAAANSPLSSKISRSLGVCGDGRVERDCETKWERGDRFLLATDGFHGLGRGLSLASLRAQLGLVEDLALGTRAESLVAAAVVADGSDNVTLVEVEIG